jgi:uncharacterized hydrophobic protein (TIGR00271 family)
MNQSLGGRFRAVGRLLRKKFSLHTDKLTPDETIAAIKAGVGFSGANLWILVFAIFLASLGLNVNSTAVIIGAMLISPLMGPIMGVGLALGINDFSLLRRSAINLLIAVVTSLVTSTLYFLVSPIKEAGTELLARTSPNIFDVLIAFLGGLAGMVAASSRLKQGNVIPGVAIATALMPPICTAGYSLANGHFADLVGAFYLFIINAVFIGLATVLIVRLLQFPLITFPDRQHQKRVRWIGAVIVTMAVLPSLLLTWLLVEKYVFNKRIAAFLQNEVAGEQRHVVSHRTVFRQNPRLLELVILGKGFDSTEYVELNQKLLEYELPNTRLEIRQGLHDANGERQMAGRLSTGIEINAMAISRLYQRYDSVLMARPQVSAFGDSVLAKLGTLAGYKPLPAGTAVFIQPVSRLVFIDSATASVDTLWQLTLVASSTIKKTEQQKLEYWLASQWPHKKWQVVFQRATK